MKYLLVALLMLPGVVYCAYAERDSLSNIIVHDPVMIRQGDTYYLFCTGNGISVFSSADRKNWQVLGPVFTAAPQWAVDAVPGFKGHIWAPDISYHNGLYYLYYSISAFGKNTSCIGVATNKTLDPKDPSFHWTDHGKLIQSYPGITNWNAIDPNLIEDDNGNAYLSFGSFWGGLQLARLSANRLHIVGDTLSFKVIASRKKNPAAPNPPSVDNNPVDAGGNAIEAPFIFKKGKYFYLFASIDYCCKGEKSTYKMIVGRAKKLTGPYIDKDGVDMARGGGSLLLQGDANWHGVGHNAVVSFDGIDYLIFHGYDAHDRGKPKLRMEPLNWLKGWPEVASETAK